MRNELVAEQRPARRACRPARREVIPCRPRPAQRRLPGRRAPGVPFDERRGVIPNDGGRVLGAERTYVAGLDQARPERRDRHEQEGRDRDGRAAARRRARRAARRRGGGDLDELLGERGVAFVEYAGWQAIDAAERARGRAARPAAREAAGVGASCSTRSAATVSTRDATRVTDAASSGAARRTKAIANFPVSGEPIPVHVARWLGRIKAAAARVNAELGLLDADKAERIAAAARPVAAGELDDQFPIDVFQTGSGTSSNMNANEVIATLAGEDVHANDDVNMGQSSNDVFPSAVHLAALDEIVTTCCRRSSSLAPRSRRRRDEFADVVKSGRTHWMDAVPVTLGQEFGGYAAQVREGNARGRGDARAARQDPARRHRRRHRAEHASRVRRAGACRARSRRPGSTISPPADPFESQAARDGLVEASGALKTRRGQPDEDRERPALPRLGPARRARRDLPARAAEGLLDHAGQGQPGHPRGRHAGRGAGDRERRRRSRSAACRATSS